MTEDPRLDLDAAASGPIFEATCRLEAAATLLAAGLLGHEGFDLPMTAEGALRLIEGARAHLEHEAA